MHRHHLIPKHMGGTDDPENLTPPISIRLHAEFHRLLWIDGGCVEDFIAWQALSGRLSGEGARLSAAKAAQSKSALYRESRSSSAVAMRRAVTLETCSRGGASASKSLVTWQQENRQSFLRQCAANGRSGAEKRQIPHSINGVTYPSKKVLQASLGVSNCGFYGMLKRGEISRLEKHHGR